MVWISFMSIIHVNDIIPVVSSTLLKKQILLLIFLYVSLLSTMPPKPSYRRNWDYTKKKFDCTYDLKRDVYNYYLRAKENPKIGYVKKLKNYWDKLHPEFNFLSDKNLRDQASHIEKNKIVMETSMDLLQQVPAKISKSMKIIA